MSFCLIFSLIFYTQIAEKEAFEIIKSNTIKERNVFLGLKPLSEKTIEENAFEIRVWVSDGDCYIIRKKEESWSAGLFPSNCYDQSCFTELEIRKSETIETWDDIGSFFDSLRLYEMKDFYELPKNPIDPKIARTGGTSMVVEMNFGGKYKSLLLLVAHEHPYFDFKQRIVDDWFYVARTLHNGLRAHFMEKKK